MEKVEINESMDLSVKNGKILIDLYGCSMGMVLLTKKEAEKLRDWLSEALKPRYKVEKRTCSKRTYWVIMDTHSINSTCSTGKRGKNIADFYENKNYDAESEARKLCKTLNETF